MPVKPNSVVKSHELLTKAAHLAIDEVNFIAKQHDLEFHYALIIFFSMVRAERHEFYKQIEKVKDEKFAKALKLGEEVMFQKNINCEDVGRTLLDMIKEMGK